MAKLSTNDKKEKGKDVKPVTKNKEEIIVKLAKLKDEKNKSSVINVTSVPEKISKIKKEKTIAESTVSENPKSSVRKMVVELPQKIKKRATCNTTKPKNKSALTEVPKSKITSKPTADETSKTKEEIYVIKETQQKTSAIKIDTYSTKSIPTKTTKKIAGNKIDIVPTTKGVINEIPVPEMPDIKLNIKTSKVVNSTKMANSPIPDEKSKKAGKIISVRYSDKDLAEFRQVIQEAKDEALDELRMLQERIDDLNSRESAGDNAYYSMHMAEQGAESSEKEKVYILINRAKEYIKKLNDSLVRIENKTYGICSNCGILIAKERLLAVPVTTQSAAFKIQGRCPEDGIDRIVKNNSNFK